MCKLLAWSLLFIVHGRFYPSKKTPDYKMIHQLLTLFWIISNILTFHFYTFSVIYTFYFYIAFEELTFYQKCSIKCVLYSLFYRQELLSIVDLISSSQNAKMSNVKTKAFSWIYLLKHLFLLETDIFPEDHFRSTSMTPSRSAINKKKKKKTR